MTLLCNPKGRSQDKYFASNHEYVVVYSRGTLPKGFFSVAKEEDQVQAEYPEEDDGGLYRLLELRNTHREFGRHNRRNLYYPLFVAEDGEVSLSDQPDFRRVVPVWEDGFEGCWTWDAAKSARDLELLIGKEVNGQWKVYRKSYASGADRMLKTILLDKSFITERGQKDLNELFGTRAKVFQSPKSPFLLGQLLRTCTGDTDLIVDFFAGSGTTGQAVMTENAADDSGRRFLLVQLPEPLDPEESGQKPGADFCDSLGKPRTIAELTKERLRRAGAKLRDENPLFAGDTGFRVFKLDSTNIQAWEPARAELEQTLEGAVEHLKTDRLEQDILYELLLKLGLDLCVPIETREIAGKRGPRRRRRSACGVPRTEYRSC